MSYLAQLQWIRSQQMAAELNCHPNTLARMRTAGVFREGHHYRPTNPDAERSPLLWHRERVLLKLNAH